jgi:hypothetical protein
MRVLHSPGALEGRQRVVIERIGFFRKYFDDDALSTI